MDLQCREIGEVAAGIVAGAGARRLGEILDRALRDAERDAGDAEGEQADRRQPVQHRRVDLAARVGAAGDPLDREAAVIRDEHVVDRDILAAGAGQADHVPGVDDRVIAGRQQEDARLVRARSPRR